jgi:hypothetical protein
MKTIFSLLYLLPIFCFGQMISFNAERPKVIPASPSAAAINKFGNYTVNLFHGLPDISVPIYEINVKNIKIPIKIAYHASGIKVNDWGTNVGTGWVLSAGGNVSRRINGQVDESNLGNVRWADGINPFQFEDYYYLQDYDKFKYDLEPDIFSYSLPGRNSGSFILNNKDGLKPILFPAEQIKIDFYLENGARYFKIIGDDGIIYHFREPEWTTSNYESGSLNNNTWQISSIISPNLTDTVSFIYTSRVGIAQRDLTDVVSITDNVWSLPGGNDHLRIYSDQFPINSTSYHDIENQEKILAEIVFPNGKVVFEQSADDRLDAFIGQKKLAGIKVYSKQNDLYTLIKNVSLNHGYFIRNNESDTRRLKLNGIVFKDKLNAEIERYSFEYNEETPMPNRLSRSRDYWGYFNNVQNETLVPQIELPFVNGSTGTSFNITAGSSNPKAREVDSLYSQSYLIKKITYPTGGFSFFEYENNRYMLSGTEKLAGGHRIKRIISYANPFTSSTIKSYKYGVNEVGYGRANFTLDNYFFQSEKIHNYWFYDGLVHLLQIKRQRTLYSNSSLNIEPFDGSPVTYSEVSEYDDYGNGINGKTVYKFSDEADVLVNTTIKGRNLLESHHLNRGQLLEKSIYKKEASGYILLQKSESKYHFFKEFTHSDLALVIGKNIIYDVGYVVGDLGGSVTNFGWPIIYFVYNEYPDFYNGFYNDFYSFGFANYSITTGIQKNIETINTIYDPINSQNTLVSTEKISYNNLNYLQPSSIEKKSSKNEIIKTEFKYPHDYISNSIYQEMVNRNMITQVVEAKEINFSKGVTTNGIKYNFDFVKGSIIDRKQLQKYNRSNSNFNTEIEYNNYDNKGNLLQFTSKDGVSSSYIFSYNTNLPVAQISNSSYGSVSYTSFESDGKGNWDYSGNINPNEGITGRNSYYLSTGFIKRSALDLGTSYTITYWVKDGSGYVNIGGNVLLNKNGWTLYEFTVKGVSELIISGNAIIDELRMYPKGAQMTTYTYLPLVGISSQSDENNRITYFVYDEYNRVKLIRDMDGNIIKSFNYQYQAK